MTTNTKRNNQKEAKSPQNKQITMEVILCCLTLPGNMTSPGMCLKASLPPKLLLSMYGQEELTVHHEPAYHSILLPNDEGTGLSTSFSASLVCYLTILM